MIMIAICRPPPWPIIMFAEEDALEASLLTSPGDAALLEATSAASTHVEEEVALSLGHYGSWRAIGSGSYAYFCSVPGLMNGGPFCDHYIAGAGADSAAADTARRGVIIECGHWSCCGSRTRLGPCLRPGGPSVAYCKALRDVDPEAAMASHAVRMVLSQLAMPVPEEGKGIASETGARAVIVGDNHYAKGRRTPRRAARLHPGDVVRLTESAAPDGDVLRSRRTLGEVLAVDVGTGMVTVRRMPLPGEAAAAASSARAGTGPTTRQYLDSVLELLPLAVTAASVIGAAASAVAAGAAGGAGRA